MDFLFAGRGLDSVSKCDLSHCQKAAKTIYRAVVK